MNCFDFRKVASQNANANSNFSSSGTTTSSSTNSVSNNSGQTASNTIAPHTLGAFSLFLQIPGYGELLLQESKEAKSLLKMALGVHDGRKDSVKPEDIAAVVYAKLNQLLKNQPLWSKCGHSLRSQCLKLGVVHHLLGCLSALTAHIPQSLPVLLKHKNVPMSSVIQGVRAWCVDQYGGSGAPPKGEGSGPAGSGGPAAPQSNSGQAPLNEAERCHYWAKGTGFGTGSTLQSWDIEQAIIRQKIQEEHIVWLLRLLHNFIGPGDVSADTLIPPKDPGDGESSSQSATISPPSTAPEDDVPGADSTKFAAEVSEEDCGPLLKEICTMLSHTELMEKVASYLSNDSGKEKLLKTLNS